MSAPAIECYNWPKLPFTKGMTLDAPPLSNRWLGFRALTRSPQEISPPVPHVPQGAKGERTAVTMFERR